MKQFLIRLLDLDVPEWVSLAQEIFQPGGRDIVRSWRNGELNFEPKKCHLRIVK